MNTVWSTREEMAQGSISALVLLATLSGTDQDASCLVATWHHTLAEAANQHPILEQLSSLSAPSCSVAVGDCDPRAGPDPWPC